MTTIIDKTEEITKKKIDELESKIIKKDGLVAKIKTKQMIKDILNKLESTDLKGLSTISKMLQVNVKPIDEELKSVENIFKNEIFITQVFSLMGEEESDFFDNKEDKISYFEKFVDITTISVSKESIEFVCNDMSDNSYNFVVQTLDQLGNEIEQKTLQQLKSSPISNLVKEKTNNAEEINAWVEVEFKIDNEKLKKTLDDKASYYFDGAYLPFEIDDIKYYIYDSDVCSITI